MIHIILYIYIYRMPVNLSAMNYTNSSEPIKHVTSLVKRPTSNNLISKRVMVSNKHFSLFSNLYLEGKSCGSCSKK